MKFHSPRLFGLFFILSFITYATGTALMDIIQNSKTLLSEVIESKVDLVVGAILIAIFHTLFNIGLVAIMFNVLASINRNLSIIYLILSSFGTFMLAIGAIFLLLPVGISEPLNQSSHFDASFFSLILRFSSTGNFYSYQLGMTLWGCGGLTFCYLLQKSRLVPALFSVWGYLGYIIFIIGCMLELFGIPYGVALSMPGGLFEIVLSIWLITKGFNDIVGFPNSTLSS